MHIAAILPLSGGRATSPLFLAAALVLFFVSSFHPASLQGSRNLVTDLFAPVLMAVNYPVEKVTSYLKAAAGITQLQAENTRLRSENTRLREWHQLALTLREENMALHDLLNVKTNPAHSYISARVIADSGNAYIKTLLVMAGRQDGVGHKQAVINSEGLIGRIIETGQSTARVLLLTDINSRIPVMIENKGGHAILAGQNDNRPLLLHLPQDLKPEDGAAVLTSGQGGIFPAGLPVGTVKAGDDGMLSVIPYADPAVTRYVRIIDKAPLANDLRSND